VLIVGSYRVGYDVALWTGAVLVVLAVAVAWCFYRDKVLHAMVLSVVFAALGLGAFALSEDLSPRRAEPNRELADRLVKVVGDAPIAAWPTGPSHALAYYANRSIPAVANRLLVHEYLPEVNRANLRQRWSDPNTRRADRVDALANWLDHRDSDVVYIVTLEPKLPMLRDFADRRGARADVVMDLTTIRAHTGEPGDPYILVRMTNVR